MLMLVIMGCAGIIILYAGGEILVKYASALGQKTGLSDLFIGLTIVAFGTSAPELVSSLIAMLKGSSGLIIGNVLGSNITNIGLILALSAMISPFATDFRRNWKDFFFLGTASTFAGLVMFTGHIDPWEGLILLGLFLLYTFYLLRSNSTMDSKIRKSQTGIDLKSLIPSIAGIVTGICLLPLGAELLVNSALRISALLGVSEHLMGLTLVAVGTSLPELATSLIAALRKRGDLCLGNIMGSNIFNVLVVPGICSIFGKLDFMAGIVRSDIIIMIIISMAAISLSFSRSYLSRREGTFLLTCYLGYIFNLVS